MNILDTYCPLAFGGFDTKSCAICCRINTKKGYYTFSEMNQDPTIQELRQSLLNGIKHPACKLCWDEEALGKISMRQEKLTLDDSTKVSLRHLVINSGNSCNLACRTCNADQSSTHIIENTIKLKHDKDYYPIIKTDTNSLLTEDYSDIRHINVLGGEPFLNLEHTKVLEHIISIGKSSTCNLSYNTNATQKISKKLINIFEQFESVGIVFSIDAIGEQFEYIRTGAIWSATEDNIKNLLNLAVKKINFQVHITISALNVLYLTELCTWLEQHNLPYSYDIAYEPECYSFQIFTDSQKKQLLETINIDKFGMVAKHIQQSNHNSKALEQFWQEIDWTNKYWQLDFNHYLPKLAKLLT